MYAVNLEVTRTFEDGSHEVRAFIISDTEPTSFPINGKDVTNMNETETFAPFTIIQVLNPTGMYILNESGTFIKQTGGSSEPVLIEKSITANGIYSAAEDEADGYSSVNVEVSGGGDISTNSFTHIEESDYEALATKDPDTLYLVEVTDISSEMTEGPLRILKKIMKGDNQIFPKIKSGYEYYLENYTTPTQANAYQGQFVLDTGVVLNSEENVLKDWQIEFNVEMAIGSPAADRVICGSGRNSHGLKELYLNSNGYLYFYSSSDLCVVSSNVQNKDVIVTKNNRTITVTVDGVQVYSGQNYDITIDTSPLRISYYRKNYVFPGTIHYFGLKFLN